MDHEFWPRIWALLLVWALALTPLLFMHNKFETRTAADPGLAAPRTPASPTERWRLGPMLTDRGDD